MTILAHSRGWWNKAAASNLFTFAAMMTARRLRRSVTRRGAPPRIDALPDYLLADLGMRRSEVEIATIWGRSRL